MTLTEFIATHGITCTRWPRAQAPELWTFRLVCDQRAMTFHHLSPTPPTLEDILARLAKAAHQHVASKLPTGLPANKDLASFKHWCLLYGFDPTSEEDRQRYLVLRRRSEQLKYVIGIEAYNRLLEIA